MRSHCCHEENGGKLRDEIPEPEFLADPGHRIKVMLGPIFKLCTSPPVKDPGRCKMVDCCRLKKYTSCFISKNRCIPIDEFVKKAKAPVEYLFNCHTWCDKEWCWAKDLDDAEHKIMTDQLKRKVRY